MIRTVEIISMIYKSVSYLDFIVGQMKEFRECPDNWVVTLRIVANDAYVPVLEALDTCDIPHTIYNDPNPNAYYINRVYRAWNFAVNTSKADYVCLVNSDCAFSNGWLTNLLKHVDEKVIPTSQLFESGKLPTMATGIVADFGRSPATFRKAEWEAFALANRRDEMVPGGTFGPVVFERKLFLDSGCYPEGNIYDDGIAGSLNGGVAQSGDAWYFAKLSREGYLHMTVSDSLVYHIQEGEKDEVQ